MNTKESMTTYITKTYADWQNAIKDRHVRTYAARLERFDAFQDKHYMNIDTLKNICDANGQFVFDQLAQETQVLFMTMCREIDEEKRTLVPERAQQERAKLQANIDNLVSLGHFAPGKKPTVEEVTLQWLRQYQAGK